MTNIPIFDGVRDIAKQYPVWLCDIWGVLHNGVAAYAAAWGALVRYREAGGTVILITNAPRPYPGIVEQITGLGVPAHAYDAIVTSGDVTRALIEAEAGRHIFHLGPERNQSLFEGLGVKLTGQDKAGLVVCTGLLDDTIETPADYRQQLAAMRSKAQPMICANPDVVVERGASICYCAGALGEAYEALGGSVQYAGKPKPPIYVAALEKAAALRGKRIDKRQVLAIGDGLKTDILGAYGFGIDALFVASAVHLDTAANLTKHSLAQLFASGPARPIAAIDRLAW